MGVLYLTGEEWLWDISREQKRSAVPTVLSGFLRRTRIHQLHNGVLEAAPLNQSPHSSGFYSHVNVKITTETFVTNAAPNGGGGGITRSRPIRSEGNG